MSRLSKLIFYEKLSKLDVPTNIENDLLDNSQHCIDSSINENGIWNYIKNFFERKVR